MATGINWLRYVECKFLVYITKIKNTQKKGLRLE